MEVWRCGVFLLLLTGTVFPVFAEKADRIVVNKSQNELLLLREDRVLGKYHVVFGANPKGHKQQSGDERTPEGRYIIDFKKSDSAFHKALHISYPNGTDLSNAKARSIEAGGDIMIHGQRNGFGWAGWLLQHFNWTDGCVALTNQDMDAVWEKVDRNTVIEINP